MTKLLIIANILGYIGLILIWIQFVFGTRHIFKYLTQNTVMINKIHKQIGIWGTLFMFAHPLFEMMDRLESWAWLIIPRFTSASETAISLGRFALIFLLVIWVTSALVREKIKWTPWKYIHLLSYPTLFLVLAHLISIGTFYGDYPFVRAIVFSLFISGIVALFVRLLAFASITKSVYTVSSKEFVGENIILVTCKPTDDRHTAIIGQHFYLQLGRFQSEHPFTIMEQNKETGELTFGIRKLGKTWDRLLAKNIGDPLYIDGPYGVFTREAQNNEEKVVISGGIGVTPFVDLVRLYGSSITYLNCNRNINEVVRPDVIKKTEKYVDIVDTYEGEQNPSIFVGRISKEIIEQVVGENYLKRNYFVCGSPGFIFIVRDLLLSLGVRKDHVFFEELGF